MRIGILGLLIGICCLTACQKRESGRTADDAELQERMSALQEELQAIQADLSADLDRRRQGIGRGTYADSPFSIAGTETILERLHRTEQALQEAQAALDDKTRAIIALRKVNAEQSTSIADLSAKAERLGRAEASRITAIQERNATLEDFEELRQRLVAAELARLERERDYYNLVTEIIRLEPGHTQDFFALQQRMKDQARNLPQPTDLEKLHQAQAELSGDFQ